jgi:integrase
LKHRLGEMGQGRLIGPDAEKTSFEDIATILQNDYIVNGRKTLKRATISLQHLRRFFGQSRALDITPDRITAYVALRQQQYAAAATINRELAALKRALSLAETAGRLPQRPRFSSLHEANARSGFFEADQLGAVLEQLPLDLKPVMQVAYITGWRVPSELLTRQRHHLDLSNGWLRLDPGETKNGEGRLFPLTPELREILEQQTERTRNLELSTGQIIPWLFHRHGKPIRDFRSAWESACERAGLVGRIPHDFRRTAVLNLERASVPRSAAMKMTGHKTEAVYRRYAIVDEAMLKEGAAKLATLHNSDRGKERTVVPLVRDSK